MKSYHAFILFFLIAAGTCQPHANALGHANPLKNVVTTVNPSPLPSLSPVPAPSPAATPGVPVISVRTITGAMPSEYAMINQGVTLVNKVLAGYCFAQWVGAANYTENNGLTSAQILGLLKAQPVSVDVEMYMGTFKENHFSKTVGYENDPWDGVVHMNRYYVNTASMVADNLIHEAEGHSQGFHHYEVFSTSEPYGMNYAYEGCAAAQQMQMPGGKPFKPPGIRIAVHKRARHMMRHHPLKRAIH